MRYHIKLMWLHLFILRDSSIQLAINSDKSTAKTAADLDLNEKTVYNWIRQYKKANNIATKFQETQLKKALKMKQRDSVKKIRYLNKSVTS